MDSASGFVSLAAAAAAFVGGHVVLSSSGLRGRLVARIGEGPFRGLFALQAAATLAWLIYAYGAAPYVDLWGNPEWVRRLALIVMPIAFMLLASGLRSDNPTSASGQPDRFDPQHTGPYAVTRHPMMWGFGLWAAVHLMANGDVASLLLFGSVGGLALGGTLAIDAKKRRTDPASWSRVTAVTSNLPLAALIAGRARLEPRRLVVPVAIGLVLYGVILHLHGWMFGVSPLP
jgi:uncharacterized membrane protein